MVSLSSQSDRTRAPLSRPLAYFLPRVRAGGTCPHGDCQTLASHSRKFRGRTVTTSLFSITALRVGRLKSYRPSAVASNR